MNAVLNRWVLRDFLNALLRHKTCIFDVGVNCPLKAVTSHELMSYS